MYSSSASLGPHTADCDYHSLRRTHTFESSNMTKSHHCQQVETIDDSLAEDGEKFSVQLSTNSSEVNLRHPIRKMYAAKVIARDSYSHFLPSVLCVLTKYLASSYRHYVY